MAGRAMLTKRMTRDLPDEIRLVILCRQIRRLEKRAEREHSFLDQHQLDDLKHQLDQFLSEYEPDAVLRTIRN
jgi:uncharacterized protein YqiB (DUF1249 family)